MSSYPIIVLGMHRSGTSMLATLLETLGVFMGDKRQGDQEAEFFLNLNEWMFRELNVTWDNSYCWNYLNEHLSCSISTFLCKVLQGDNRVHFLGEQLASQFSDITEIDIPWGWKDPRNTFTFDIWSNIFPRARYIHIHRNPLDVAASLRSRELKRKQVIQKMIESDGVGSVVASQLKLQTSARAENLSEGIKLWHEYLSKALEIERITGERMLRVRYEDIAENPAGFIDRISLHAGINPAPARKNKALSLINERRAYVFTKDPELARTYQAIKDSPIMKELGYANIRCPTTG